MKPSIFSSKLCSVALAITMSASASSNDANPLVGFDFSYEIGGNRAVTPLQVFDDGVKTYIQWATNVPSGRLIVQFDGKSVKPEAGATPYFVVSGIAKKITVANGPVTAYVGYVGERGVVGSARSATAKSLNAYTAPPTAQEVAAVASAVNRDRWEINVSDRSVRAALSRWAQAANLQLQWLMADEFLVDHNGAYSGTLAAALSALSADLGLNIAVDGATLKVQEKTQ